MSQRTTKPSQFRLPAWAQEFLAEESAASGATKTEVVLEALKGYEAKRFEDRMIEGYRAMAEENLAEARAWESTLADGLEDGEW